MGLLGILFALGLLTWLAFRGWSVLLLAPMAADPQPGRLAVTKLRERAYWSEPLNVIRTAGP